MKNLKLLFGITLAVVCTTKLSAQNLKNHLVDTARKTEIGVNTVPVLIFAFNADDINSYTLNLRMQHNKHAWRYKLIYKEQTWINEPVSHFTVDDTVINWQVTTHDAEKYIGAAAGLEFYNPNKKFRWYWGFDLIGRYYINSTQYSEYSSAIDSNGYASDTYDQSTPHNFGQVDKSEWAAGAGIKGGIRFPISKHFFLQTETHFEFMYRFIPTYKEQGNTASISKSTTTTFNLEADGLIPELTLYYRF
ncbi:MAG: hypothetical protein ABI723_14205 [Bacteroidia bacterium]